MAATLDRGWLAYGDVEIFNNDRAFSYARNGDSLLSGGILWDAISDLPECSCWASRVRTCDDPNGAFVEGDPIIYTLPSGEDLTDRVPALTGGDVAPWYDPAIPASNEFYGIYLRSISGLESVPYTRTVAQTGINCGGILRSPKITGREMVVSATMFAATCEGMEYGKRWLNDMLLGCGSNGCVDPDMVVQLYCPDEANGDPNEGIRKLCSVGVIQMPQYRTQNNSWCCNISEFNMIFYAENPYLHYLDEEAILDEEGFNFDAEDSFSDVCCDERLSCMGSSFAVATLMQTPTFVTESTLRIEIEPGCYLCGCPELDEFGEEIPGKDVWTLEEYVDLEFEPCSDDEPADACDIRVTVMPAMHEECPVCPTKDALIDFYIRKIPAGQKFVLDGCARDAYFADSKGNRLGTALNQIDPAESFDIFPYIAPCAKVCVQVVGTECGTPLDTQVSVTRIDREI